MRISAGSDVRPAKPKPSDERIQKMETIISYFVTGILIIVIVPIWVMEKILFFFYDIYERVKEWLTRVLTH